MGRTRLIPTPVTLLAVSLNLSALN
uniref:Uncharacterized protein n=1 Tax=Anguilla anguilla TaxID=7936 RepID=A0A0E9S695_ANGAN